MENIRKANVEQGERFRVDMRQCLPLIPVTCIKQLLQCSENNASIMK